MKQLGAKTILAVMMLGVLATAGHRLVENTLALTILKEKEKTNNALLHEIKNDVKTLLHGK